MAGDGRARDGGGRLGGGRLGGSLRAAVGIAVLAASLLITAGPVWGEPADSVEFFENRIRPVLVKHCYECHSSESKEIGGSLVLDSSRGMMTGGDSGPAIAPGDAETSVLISALRYESSEMPPSGRLPEHVIGDFAKWINAGAIDPRQVPANQLPSRSQIDLESGRKFWAFRPLADSSVPTGHHDHSQGTIDQYLDDRLHEAGLIPNDIAEPAVRLRRLAFDLTGLPPEPHQLSRWLEDPSERHWRQMVDSMLASRAFGEHWARHWMDVARYADSNGADFNATHHEAWRYRDYLIRSFSADTPFDQMIRQQVAGDLMPGDDDDQRYDNVVASTFLMLGTKMLSERDKPKLTLDVVDEQIDTVGRAFLGLTLGCARCHDHKFDPIPSEDYYALAGIFRSTITLNGESQQYVSTWNRVKLPTTPQHVAALQQHDQAVKTLTAKIKLAEADLKRAKASGPTRLAGTIVDDRDAKKTGAWKASTYYKHFVGEGYVHDDNAGKGDASIRFQVRLPESGQYELRLAHSPGSNRASAVPITIQTADGERQITADQRKTQIDEMWSSLGTFPFSSERDAVVTISNRGTSGYVIADAVQFLSVAARQAANDASSPDASSPDAANAVAKASADVESLKKQLAELKKAAPPPLPEAMAPADRPTGQIADSPLHIRGEVTNLGPVIPRGFLQVCGSGDSTMGDPQGSGRLQLADWLTDPDNPLVSRVFVNRIWMHLLGEGLVRTVDNFGTQGQRPTHPQLLDALATEFVRGGWRVKPLIRKIVLSAAYQRSSHYDAQSIAIDPENRLLWRMPRRRIPAEAIRDAMLAAAGTLDRRARTEPMKGRGTLVSSNNSDSRASFDDIAQPCRSIYLPLVRGYLPPLMTALDTADPDLLVGKRPTTNVPAQALVLINSPEVNQWALLAAKRILATADRLDDRLQHAYLLCLQRKPTDSDLEIARAVLGDDSPQHDSLEAWHEVVSALFASTEFRLLE